jgi:hypothetical protein
MVYSDPQEGISKMMPPEKSNIRVWALVDDQIAEINHLRAALLEIANDPTGLSIGQSEIAKLTLASHMYSGKWVRQTDDGSIVPGYKP